MSCASVEVDGHTVGAIGRGLLILLGVEQGDTDKELVWCAHKAAGLRIFPDDEGKMNRSLSELNGEALVVSQFTLCADVQKGRRPSFVSAAAPEFANQMYEKFVARLREIGVRTATGKFQAKMAVTLVNDGPVTIWIECTPGERD